MCISTIILFCKIAQGDIRLVTTEQTLVKKKSPNDTLSVIVDPKPAEGYPEIHRARAGRVAGT